MKNISEHNKSLYISLTLALKLTNTEHEVLLLDDDILWGSFVVSNNFTVKNIFYFEQAKYVHNRLLRRWLLSSESKLFILKKFFSTTQRRRVWKIRPRIFIVGIFTPEIYAVKVVKKDIRIFRQCIIVFLKVQPMWWII